MARSKKSETTGSGTIKEIETGAAKSKTKEPNTVCRSIRRYRELRGLEQKELARRLGVPASAVSNWETGYSKPTLDVLVPVAGILGISLYELFGVDDPAAGYTEKEQRLLSKYRGLSEGHRYAVEQLTEALAVSEAMDDCPELTRLTYFSRQLAAGVGDPTDFLDEGEPIYLYSSELADKADYVFSVNGDSMEPVYRGGDMVLIKSYPECGDIRTGEVGAFIIGNEAYIKEYRRDGLHSFNKAYRTMQFTEEDKVYFIGKVIGTLDSGDIATAKDIERYAAARPEEV